MQLKGLDEEMESACRTAALLRPIRLPSSLRSWAFPADKLQESVDGYNAAYEAGKDVKFDVPAQFLLEIKTAPFYATPVVCPF